MLKFAAAAFALTLAATASAATPEQRAEAVLTKAPLIDGHNDLPGRIRELVGKDFSKVDLANLPPDARAKMHTDIGRLRKGHVGGQFWSVWIPVALPRHEAVTQTLEQIDTVERFVARYPETFAFARTSADVEAAMKRGRIASLVGMEGGHSIGNSLAILRQMYRAGARYMTLTHTLNTDWADSATDAPKHGGLSPFGEEVVREMNRLGMLVDLSHVSEETMLDALAIAKAPVIFSHSGARAVDGHARNVPDNVLKRLPANGGVVMVVFYPDFVSEELRQWAARRAGEEARANALNRGNPDAAKAALDAWIAANPRPAATVAQVADHIDHICTLAGIDHIGIGGDYDGMDNAPAGLEDVSTYPALFAELARRGYSDADLAKIAQGNILRALKAAEATAQSMKGSPPSNATIGGASAAGGR
jgi:membrane dipeptidase